MRIVAPVALQRAEIVGVAEFIPQLFEDRPVATRSFAPDLVFEMFLEVCRDAVVIQERIIHVKKKNDLRASGFFVSTSFHVSSV